MSPRRQKPDASDRLLSGLGLAARAGKLRMGTEAVTKSIRHGEATMIVIAGDASPSTRIRLEQLGNARSLPLRVVLDGERLGQAVGRDRVVALAVTDGSLGGRVLQWVEALAGSR